MMQYFLLRIASLTSSTVEKEVKIHCARLWVKMVLYSFLCHDYGMDEHSDIG